jgi:hypothetical protein
MLLRTGLTGLVTLVFTKCEKQAPSELSFVKRARPGPNGVDWRALTVWDVGAVGEVMRSPLP